MALRLPRFCAILDPSLRPELALEELARVLAQAGVQLVQLRAKQATTAQLLSQARLLLSLLASGTLLVVNDRADVAAVAGAAGVHLGQEDLPVEAARELLGPEKLIGVSTHSEGQIDAARSLPVDYVAFGPVFPTATKAGAEPAVGLDGLRKARGRTNKPLVAIGGITVENAAAVLEGGADAVAVISGWLAADDIPGRLDAFRRALGRLE